MKSIITLVITIIAFNANASSESTGSIENRERKISLYHAEDSIALDISAVMAISSRSIADVIRENQKIIGESYELVPAVKTIEQIMFEDRQIIESVLPEAYVLNIKENCAAPVFKKCGVAMAN